MVSESQTYGFAWSDTWGSHDGTEVVAEDSTVYGFLFTRCGGGFWQTNLTRLFAFECAGDGFSFFSNWGEVAAGTLVADDNDIGINVIYNRHINFDTINAYSNTSHGLLLRDVFLLDIDASTIDSNGGYGVYIDENTSANRGGHTFFNGDGTLVISNNTSGGIIAKNMSVVGINDCTGGGNGNYGLELEEGATATITTDTGITGASGDATINDGSTTLTWATHFATDGDIAINHDNNCRIERKD